jgi:hypothetical protein
VTELPEGLGTFQSESCRTHEPANWGGRTRTFNFLINRQIIGLTNYEEMSAFIGGPGVGAGVFLQECRGLPGETGSETAPLFWARIGESEPCATVDIGAKNSLMGGQVTPGTTSHDRNCLQRLRLPASQPRGVLLSAPDCDKTTHVEESTLAKLRQLYSSGCFRLADSALRRTEPSRRTSASRHPVDS